MKKFKYLKLIAIILISIILIIIGINVSSHGNLKDDKAGKPTVNNTSEASLVHENTEDESNVPESTPETNLDESKNITQAGITKPNSSNTLRDPNKPGTSETQLNTTESATNEIRTSECSTTEPSLINKQMFSEICENIIKPTMNSFNGEIDIYFEILNHDLVFASRKEPMYSASLAKLFLMGTIFQAIEDGIIEFNDNIAYDLQIMITISDNASFNRLFYLLQDTVPERNMFDFVDDFCEQNNFSQTTIHNLIIVNGNERFVYPTDFVFETSAKDVGRFLSMIYQGELVNEEASKKMYELLADQERTWKIPALLPDKAITANKTGEKEPFSHDAAIIKSPNCDYVLTVMTDSANSYQANLLMQNLSLEIYNYLNP